MPAQNVSERAHLPEIERKTVVDQVVRAIVQAASEGRILPGDRIIERDISMDLQVSRAPVREALRLLESQGVVDNSPYRGMRLMEIDAGKFEDLTAVRLQMELLAAANLLAKPAEVLEKALAAMDAANVKLRNAIEAKDHYLLAVADMSFHSVSIQMSGNRTLLQVWKVVETQLTVLFGLSSKQKNLPSILKEHERLRADFATGDPATVESSLKNHIIDNAAWVDVAKLRVQER
ncbi:GntR family transcriptional regulator [Labrys neptuniae]